MFVFESRKVADEVADEKSSSTETLRAGTSDYVPLKYYAIFEKTKNKMLQILNVLRFASPLKVQLVPRHAKKLHPSNEGLYNLQWRRPPQIPRLLDYLFSRRITAESRLRVGVGHETETADILEDRYSRT